MLHLEEDRGLRMKALPTPGFPTVATLEDSKSVSRLHTPQTNSNIISTGIFASESSQDDFNKASQTGVVTVAMKARLASPTNEQKIQESIKLVMGGDMRKREEEAVWPWARRSGGDFWGSKEMVEKALGNKEGT